jgi:single-strand DNA-binding protein
MNQLYIIGYLTADSTTRATSTGKTVTTFTVGVTRSRKDANGDRVSDFFRVNAWGATADFCGRYLTKGSRVAVIGELTPSTYEGKDGKTRFSLDVQADKVENLTEKKQEPEKEKPVSEWDDISSDDLPFGR